MQETELALEVKARLTVLSCGCGRSSIARQ